MGKIIIDVNIAHRVFNINDPEFTLLREALFDAHSALKAVVNRNYESTAGTNGMVKRSLYRLWRSAKVDFIPTDRIEMESGKIEASGLCVSDDCMILALARLSDARVLVTEDQPLQRDFCNCKIINKPRGKIYLYPDRHRHILTNILQRKSGR